MKKFYRVFFLLIILIIVSTFNPSKLDITFNKENGFFKIKKIEIINNSIIEKSEIKKKLNKIYDKNIFFINNEELTLPLKEINFFDKVKVKKKYPNTIIVEIFETKPVAILFKKKTKYILDSSSNLIAFNDDINLEGLPNVFGNNAQNNFLIFFNLLLKNNFPSEKVKNFYFFQIGRWDIQLFDNKIIKFPYNNVENAIIKSVKLLDRKDFENYNIIDLRVEGKIIVE